MSSFWHNALKYILLFSDTFVLNLFNSYRNTKGCPTSNIKTLPPIYKLLMLIKQHMIEVFKKSKISLVMTLTIFKNITHINVHKKQKRRKGYIIIQIR